MVQDRNLLRLGMHLVCDRCPIKCVEGDSPVYLDAEGSYSRGEGEDATNVVLAKCQVIRLHGKQIHILRPIEYSYEWANDRDVGGATVRWIVMQVPKEATK